MIFAIAVACSVWIYLHYQPDSLELAHLYARALRTELEPPALTTKRSKGVTELNCRRDAWICADTDYKKIEKKIHGSDEGSIPYARLLATRKVVGSPSQHVVFTRGKSQTYGNSKQFRVIPRTDNNLTNEASELCTSIGAILHQMTRLLSQPDTETHQPVRFEHLRRALSMPDARALLQALYVGHAWGLVELIRKLSYVKLATLVFQPYTTAAEKIGGRLQIRLTENGLEWFKVPGELKSQAAKIRARQAKPTTYINRADNVIVGEQNHVRVTKMEKGSGDHFENNQSTIGVQGPNARVRRVSQRVSQRQAAVDGGDLSNLITELEKLRAELARTADTADKSRAVAEVHDAKEAAERSDKGAIDRHLLKSGQWALDAAMRVGLPIAEAALKQALGISS